MNALTAYLDDLSADWITSQDRFNDLARPGVATHPIPFFGDIRRARVLTVGVNPSAEEFAVKRRWPASLTATELERRLVGYFVDAPAPPHDWFNTWSKALESLGVSYEDGAAHVDLSPRATISMGSANQAAFSRMVEADAAWFFRLLPLCPAARVLLLAGCVTKRWYMNEFLARVATASGFQLHGKGEAKGEGRVGFYRLTGPGVDLPVFSCSVSPSSWNPELLIERVREHQASIREWLAVKPATGG